jgi:hypothetical protein
MIASSANREIPSWRRTGNGIAAFILFALLMTELPAYGLFQKQSNVASAGISRAAAESCDAKVKKMETRAGDHGRGRKLETRLSETELNSYLAICLSPNYHPCLRGILVKLDEGRLQAVASIDFDRLQLNSTQLINGLLKKMLTGVHKLTIRGGLISNTGTASFRLDEAQFDSITLPNLLISEIISAVGRKQNPPLDPMQPSALPYLIQKVDVHSGYILVQQ